MSVDYSVELDTQTNPQSTDEFTTRYHWLIANGKKKEADALRDQWSKNASKVSLAKPSDELWHMIAHPAVDLTPLPLASWFLQFTFTLAKPYISKDDNPFYIIDNPIVRDKVFQLPMVRSTSWKGNLYSALWQLGHDKQSDVQLQRLFGEIRGEESGQAGRLYFYPTFFTQTSLEIINPHDREKRVGKNPILFESVPAGATGTFTLLYVPCDLIGQSEAATRAQVAEDAQLLAQGLQAMFRTYGFGAKTSSGYGVARERVDKGKLVINMAEPTPRTMETTTSNDEVTTQLQADVADFLRRFGLDEFPHWTNAELKKSGWGDKRQSEYKRLRNRHPDWDNAAGIWREPQQKLITDKVEAPTPRLSRTFASFDELVVLTEQVAQPLTGGGA